MKLTLDKEKIEFDFPNAIELFKFDEQDKNSRYYHGVSYCMKGVDVVAVFEGYQLWIEIKEFPDDKSLRRQRCIADSIYFSDQSS